MYFTMYCIIIFRPWNYLFLLRTKVKAFVKKFIYSKNFVYVFSCIYKISCMYVYTRYTVHDTRYRQFSCIHGHISSPDTVSDHSVWEWSQTLREATDEWSQTHTGSPSTLNFTFASRQCFLRQCHLRPFYVKFFKRTLYISITVLCFQLFRF